MRQQKNEQISTFIDAALRTQLLPSGWHSEKTRTFHLNADEVFFPVICIFSICNICTCRVSYLAVCWFQIHQGRHSSSAQHRAKLVCVCLFDKSASPPPIFEKNLNKIFPRCASKMMSVTCDCHRPEIYSMYPKCFVFFA